MAANRRQSDASIGPAKGNRGPQMQAQIDAYWQLVDTQKPLGFLNPGLKAYVDNLQAQLVKATGPCRPFGAK